MNHLLSASHYREHLHQGLDSGRDHIMLPTKEIVARDDVRRMLQNLNVIIAAAGAKAYIDCSADQNPHCLGYWVPGTSQVQASHHTLFADTHTVKGTVTHELIHEKTEITDLALQEADFSLDHLSILFGEMDEAMINLGVRDGITLVEGLTQTLTEQKIGYEMHHVYEEEKTLAQKLESLTMRKYSLSLLHFFEQGKPQMVLGLLKQLADQLLLEEALSKNSDLEDEDYFELLDCIGNGAFPEEPIAIQSYAQAEQLISEWTVARLSVRDEIIDVSSVFFS